METKTTQEREQTLIRNILRGQPDLFRELIEPHQRYIQLKARSILGNAADAEDASQQAIWHAYLHLSDFRQEASFRTWITRITINEAMARLRRNSHPLISLDQSLTSEGPSPAHFLADSDPLPPVQLEQQQTAALLREAIERLPQTLRTVVELRDFEELNTHQTAAALRVTVTTVKTRHHRARRFLRRLLAPAPAFDSRKFTTRQRRPAALEGR